MIMYDKEKKMFPKKSTSLHLLEKRSKRFAKTKNFDILKLSRGYALGHI